jgi:hypothetical protein
MVKMSFVLVGRLGDEMTLWQGMRKAKTALGLVQVVMFSRG